MVIWDFLFCCKVKIIKFFIKNKFRKYLIVYNIINSYEVFFLYYFIKLF